ncbi:MAG TPA: autotransporter-associated beta strand repeat-containing protein, partial [Thermoanaerobaculia bacterium]|nr:autotransporter-associated beta strand repeat-containing protein [Thermoanaerobaculia bacterium]
GVNAWAGPINLSIDSSISVTGGTLNITGAISGGSSLAKVGGGTLFLSGTNTYTIGTGVFDGTLIVNGTLDTASTVGVLSGATLGGSGSVGSLSVASNGMLSPGQSPGILSSRSIAFTSGSTFRVELNGTTPGAGHDQLAVNGSVSLGGATLSATVTSGFVPPPFSTYTIVSNDGADAVNGTFNGLGEGSNVQISGYRFTISYVGGDGNDVVLTRSPGTFIWSGAAGNSWSNGFNWNVLGFGPASGDNLVFPAGGNPSSVNDFPPGFLVNSITISGTSYVINTNQMVLYNGLFATNSSGVNTISSTGSLAQTQTFTVTNAAASLNLQGTWTANGLDWIFDGTGGTASTANLGGSFNLVKNGTGSLSITSNNSYTGTTLINSGLVFVQATDAFGTGASPVTVASGGAIQVNGVSPTKTLFLNGSGVGGAGALRGSSFGGGWAGNIVLNTPATIGSNTSAFLISGVVSGSGDLTTTTAGPIFLTNANTFTGAVTIQSGPLQISNGAALGDTTNGVSIVSGTLEVVGGINVGAEPLTFAMGGSSPTLRSASGSNTWAGNVALQTNGIFNADPGSDLAINGTISGAFGVSKNLAGTITFGGANAYTGTTTVNAGTLRVTNGGALGTAAGQTAVLSGSSLVVDGGGAGITVGNELIVLNGTGGGSGAMQSVNGSNVLNGTVTL